MEKKHYGAIDGLRTIACIGIVMMHVASNNSYDIRNGWMQYSATDVMILVSVVTFAVVMQKMIAFAEDKSKVLQRQGS